MWISRKDFMSLVHSIEQAQSDLRNESRHSKSLEIELNKKDYEITELRNTLEKTGLLYKRLEARNLELQDQIQSLSSRQSAIREEDFTDILGEDPKIVEELVKDIKLHGRDAVIVRETSK